MYMINTQAGFYLEILFWGGNMVDKNSKKGHNTLICTVGAFATYKPALAFNTHNDIMYLYLCN